MSNSRIEQIIEEIEDYIDSCKGPLFGGGDKIVVDRERMEELLRELRMKTPEEIKRYQSEGLDRAVFDRLHRASYAQTLRAFNSTEDIAGDLLVYRFEGIDLLDYPKIVASVAFEDVCTLLRDAFGENDFVLSTVLPLDKNA